MKKGFTLTEVLITIAILGVIGAMTIPAVILGTNREETVVNLKESFNSLKKAVKSSETDNDSIRSWVWTNSAQDFDTYLRPYLNIMKDCGTEPGDCFIKEYKDIKGADGGKTFGSGNRYFVLANGKTYAFTPQVGGGSFFVDVNGKKGPNKYGVDLFEFAIEKSVGIKPACFEEDTTTINTKCKATGECCAQKVLSEGKMDY